MESLFTLHFDLGQKILSLGTYLSPVRVVYKAGGKKRENKNKKGCVLWGIGRVFPTWEFWKSPRVIKIRGFFCCCCSGDPAPGRGCCCFFFFFYHPPCPCPAPPISSVLHTSFLCILSPVPGPHTWDVSRSKFPKLNWPLWRENRSVCPCCLMFSP